MHTRLRVTTSGNFAFYDRDLSPAEGASLWETCPLLAARSDPETAFEFADNGIGYDGSRYTATMTGSATVAAGVTRGGGILLSCGGTTTDLGANLQVKGTPFQRVAAKHLWFEASLSVSILTGRFVVGLAPTTTAILSGTTLNPASYLLFTSTGGAGVVNIKCSQSGGSLATAALADPLVAGTSVRLGFYMDCDTPLVTYYQNGVSLGTIGGSTTLPSVVLSPLVACYANGTGTPTLTLNRWRVVQLW